IKIQNMRDQADWLLRNIIPIHVKIKTIGATYMAASGLNTQQCSDQAHPHAHLRALFQFSLEMMHVVDDFNKNMLGFKFKLRIGFNHGPLTAGVIGTTKLLYDIWGDTVNIASRMDTTGVECRVQVSEESYCVLMLLYLGTVHVGKWFFSSAANLP
uniref:adenylate cyclase n=1 Tax=Sinocyclocheilus grahami TaxID=75366 RepID=A0A672Q0E3_SINGR